MRQLTFPLVMLLLALSANAQKTNQQSKISRENYLEKSKTQRNTGRIFLAAGAGLLITSILIPEGKLTEEGLPGGGYIFPDKHKNDGVRAAFAFVGFISAAASIPFFIAARKNRRRASYVGLDFEKTQILAGQNLVFTSIPALHFKISLSQNDR